MSDQTNKWLDRVRGLLAKAESTNSEHEAEACRSKALQLIAKYGIDEALLAVEDPKLRTVGDIRFEAHAPFSIEKVQLWQAIAVPLGIQSVRLERWRDGGYRRAGQGDRKVLTVHAFGRTGDLERAQLLYTSLLMQQATEFARVDPARAGSVGYTSNGQDKAAYRRSWLVAYAARIYARFEELVQDATREASGARGNDSAKTALVLADRDEAIADAFRAEYPRTRTATRKLSDGGGWSAGREAADRADLGGTRVGGGRKGELA